MDEWSERFKRKRANHLRSKKKKCIKDKREWKRIAEDDVDDPG